MGSYVQTSKERTGDGIYVLLMPAQFHIYMFIFYETLHFIVDWSILCSIALAECFQMMQMEYDVVEEIIYGLESGILFGYVMLPMFTI